MFSPTSFKELIGTSLAVVGGIQSFTMPNEYETSESESETDDEDELFDDELSD
jgi:hypothetical protein